jgi:hypothetical protein
MVDIDFANNVALAVLVFIFAVECIELTVRSSLVTSLWDRVRKTSVVIETQNSWHKYRIAARKLGIPYAPLSQSEHSSPKVQPMRHVRHTVDSPAHRVEIKDITGGGQQEGGLHVGVDIETGTTPPRTPLDSFKVKRTSHLRNKMSRVTPRHTAHANYGKGKTATNAVIIDTMDTDGKMVIGENKKGKGELRKSPQKKINMDSVNTYDLFKVFSTLAMFIDHYGYMGLPGFHGEDRSWLRVYGRAAAPGFFFLCGYSSKRFRLRVWMAALFLYIFTAHYFLDIVYAPFESLLSVALINCVFRYLPPHKVLFHPFLSIVLFSCLALIREYASQELRIGYGTVPFMLAIAGDLARHKHNMRIPWVIASMSAFAYSSKMFAHKRNDMLLWIIGESCVNAVFMLFFVLVEVPVFNRLPEPFLSVVRDGIKWLSRQGLYIYVGHLTLFRLISHVAQQRLYLQM